jgi:serine/threonine protein kinase
MHDLSGTQIGRYIIENELGRGGMSRVYRARDTNLDREVALKVLLPEMAADADSVARFLREARAAARLAHQHIVPVHDSGHADSYYFIAMRFIDGRTLRENLMTGQFESRQVGEILAQIASALDYAHRKGIMHRDIKPENILIDHDGMAMLTDFGIASAADELRVTATGQVVGTPVYMAPEQLRGEPATPRSEIYALGILAYELLTGTTPFAGRPAYAVMLAHLDERPQPVDHIQMGIAPSVAAIIGRALEKDPSDRFDSAGQFADQLHDALGGTSVSSALRQPQASVPAESAAPTLVGAVMPSPRERHRLRSPGRFLPYLSAGVILGIVLVTVSLFAGGEAPAGEDAGLEVVAAVETPTTKPPPTSAVETPTVEPLSTSTMTAYSDEPVQRSPDSTGRARIPDAVPVSTGHEGLSEQGTDVTVVPAPEPIEESAVVPVEPESQNTVDVSDTDQPDDPIGESENQGGSSDKPDNDKKDKPEKEKSKEEEQEDEREKTDSPGNDQSTSDDPPGNSGNAPGTGGADADNSSKSKEKKKD